jgi:hypothetical protein
MADLSCSECDRPLRVLRALLRAPHRAPITSLSGVHAWVRSGSQPSHNVSLYKHFSLLVCNECRKDNPKYALITKSRAKADLLLTDKARIYYAPRAACLRVRVFSAPVRA